MPAFLARLRAFVKAAPMPRGMSVKCLPLCPSIVQNDEATRLKKKKVIKEYLFRNRYKQLTKPRQIN